jgi:predicted metal-dependent HD superfamily phosphohydrolase
MGLGDQEIEVVEMAAWFHDVGYIDTVEGHEERSVELARKFLTEAGCPAEEVNRVIGCIRATRLPQQPTTIEEQVLCDADLLHLGKENFFDRGDLLKEEIELRSGVRHDRAEWLRINLEFLKRHPFHTAFARRMYGPRREANIEEVQRRLAGLSNEDSL